MSFNGYNLIAPYYQTLVGLVFGNLLFKAQTFFLNDQFQPNSILIIGGGSGQLLRYCAVKYPESTVSYVDSSEKMISLSQKSIAKKDFGRIQFYAVDFFDWKSQKRYDLILLPFVLDLYNTQKCTELFEKLTANYSAESTFIVTDFNRNNSKTQLLVLKSMYSLFGLLNGAEVTRLPNFELVYKLAQLKVVGHRYFGKGWQKNFVSSYQLEPSSNR